MQFWIWLAFIWHTQHVIIDVISIMIAIRNIRESNIIPLINKIRFPRTSAQRAGSYFLAICIIIEAWHGSTGGISVWGVAVIRVVAVST